MTEMSEPTPVPAPPRPPLPGPSPSGPGAVPARPAPPGLAAGTGHPGVDAALARLEELGEVPTDEHGALYEGVHEQLRQVLAALDRPHP